MQLAQALDVAFTKQVAAFADFLDQLFKGNFFPLALAPLANPFEAVSDAIGAGDLRHHGIATGTGSGAASQALIFKTTDTFQGIHDGRGLGQVRIAGQRVIGVADHAQDLFAGVVHPYPHAAQRGAAIADGKGGALIGVERQFAGGAVNTVLGRQRVAVNAVIGLFTRGAFQAMGHFQQRVGIAGHKSGGTTCCDCAFQQATTGKIRLIHGVQLLLG